MLAALAAEALKLRRSLVLLLCAAAPLMVALLCAVMAMDHGAKGLWERYALGGTALWAFFMLPMTVTALTILLAQTEHGPRAWNHLLALPVPRWRYYVAKAVVVFALLALMSALLWVGLIGGGLVADRLSDKVEFSGPLPLWPVAKVLLTMLAGAVLVTALQLWAALRFRSFVPPLVLGIGGTFVAVAATGAKQGAFFPWLIPTNALAADPARADVAIGVGLWGGLAVLALMLAHLSRYEPQ